MSSTRKMRFNRILSAGIFFFLTLLQMVIVSWISISQVPKEDSRIAFTKFFGFYVSINPFADFNFTAILVILTGFLQILLMVFLINIVFSNKNMIQIYPVPKTGPAYSPEETLLVEKTVNLVTKVSKNVKIKVSKIFVYRKSVPNAFSLDLLPIPLLRRPYIVLNTNVLEILSEQEIEAVVAHELAHVKHGDSLIRLVLSIPRLFLNLAYLFIYLQILTGIQIVIFENFDLYSALERGIFLLLVYLLVEFITKLTLRFLYSANGRAEFLADYFAAQHTGPDILINSLVHLGQRSEAMQILSNEIEWLNNLAGEKKPTSSFMRGINQRFPRTQLNEDVAREIAPRIFLEEKLHRLMTAYGLEFDQKYIDQLIDQAVPALLKKRADYFDTITEDNQNILTPSILKDKTIDWRVFDSNDSYFLEIEEIKNFIITLLSQPHKMIFEHEILQTPTKDSDHPSFRARILRIFEIFYSSEYLEIIQYLENEKTNKHVVG